MNVFRWGLPNVGKGKQVTVGGTFAAVKHVGSYTFRNEIEADEGSLGQSDAGKNDVSRLSALDHALTSVVGRSGCSLEHPNRKRRFLPAKIESADFCTRYLLRNCLENLLAQK